MIDGAVRLADTALGNGDAAKITDQEQVSIIAEQTSELILVDVPMTFEAVGNWRGRI